MPAEILRLWIYSARKGHQLFKSWTVLIIPKFCEQDEKKEAQNKQQQEL